MASVNSIAPNIKKRTIKEKYRLFHKINIRNGLYRFLGHNLIKLIIALIIIVLAIFLIDYIFDLEKQYENIQAFVTKLRPGLVFAFFIVTESILGFIPPDIFIVWGKTRFPENTYFIVAVLATLSYIGGINAYFIGKLIRKSSVINKYVQKKYEKNFNLIEKWGGLVVIMAALFPLPFALISTIAGIVKYPFKSYLLYGLTRYIRFFLYAIVIFGAIKKFL